MKIYLQYSKLIIVIVAFLKVNYGTKICFYYRCSADKSKNSHLKIVKCVKFRYVFSRILHSRNLQSVNFEYLS